MEPSILKLQLINALLPGSSSTTEGFWKRLYSFGHCPPQCRPPPADGSVGHPGGSIAGVLSARDLRMLLLLYAAAAQMCAERNGEMGGEMPQPPDEFVAELPRHRAWLAAML